MATVLPLASPNDAARDFLAALGPLPAGEPAPLATLRSAARARFAESGLPTRRHEAWRFTELRPLVEARLPAAGAPVGLERLDALIAEGIGTDQPVDRLVFVNGRLDPSRSAVGTLPAGVRLGSFAAWAAAEPEAAAAQFDLAGGAERAFLSLNAAAFTDGPVLIVPAGTMLERPVQVIHWNAAAAPGAAQLRGLIRLGERAAATVIESFAGSGAGWTNSAVTIELAPLARLGRYVLQDEAPEAFHTAHLAASIGRGAHLDGFLLSLGGRIARQDAWITLAGEHAFCGYSGAYLLQGRQESALASVIEHAAPNGRTREVFKGCLADRAHGVFQGKIRVAPDAQKTDGYQLNKTLLLGDRAVMDSKPELEIYADDVKCSHGATVGDLDAAALFYLRARGITAEVARQMLIEAFVVDAVELVEDEAGLAFLRRAVTRRIARGLA